MIPYDRCETSQMLNFDIRLTSLNYDTQGMYDAAAVSAAVVVATAAAVEAPAAAATAAAIAAAASAYAAAVVLRMMTVVTFVFFKVFAHFQRYLVRGHPLNRLYMLQELYILL